MRIDRKQKGEIGHDGDEGVMGDEKKCGRRRGVMGDEKE
jgi:hypothetical protein